MGGRMDDWVGLVEGWLANGGWEEGGVQGRSHGISSVTVHRTATTSTQHTTASAGRTHKRSHRSLVACGVIRTQTTHQPNTLHIPRKERPNDLFAPPPPFQSPPSQARFPLSFSTLSASNWLLKKYMLQGLVKSF
ncbi:hypothetical protein SK128_016162, partial [Halocaridina rubra]